MRKHHTSGKDRERDGRTERALAAAHDAIATAYNAGHNAGAHGIPRDLLDAIRYGDPGDVVTIPCGDVRVACVLTRAGDGTRTRAAAALTHQAILDAIAAHAPAGCPGLAYAPVPDLTAIAWANPAPVYLVNPDVTPQQRRQALAALRRTLAALPPLAFAAFAVRYLVDGAKAALGDPLAAAGVVAVAAAAATSPGETPTTSEPQPVITASHPARSDADLPRPAAPRQKLRPAAPAADETPAATGPAPSSSPAPEPQEIPHLPDVSPKPAPNAAPAATPSRPKLKHPRRPAPARNAHRARHGIRAHPDRPR